MDKSTSLSAEADALRIAPPVRKTHMEHWHSVDTYFGVRTMAYRRYVTVRSPGWAADTLHNFEKAYKRLERWLGKKRIDQITPKTSGERMKASSEPSSPPRPPSKRTAGVGAGPRRTEGMRQPSPPFGWPSLFSMPSR